MYYFHTNIQESRERVLCAQEQGSCFKQARPFPQIKRQIGEFIGIVWFGWRIIYDETIC